jgi:hypothetical protein
VDRVYDHVREDLMSEPAYPINSDGEEIVVRLRRDALDRNEVSRFLDFLELDADGARIAR